MTVPESYSGKNIPLMITINGGEVKEMLEEEGVAVLIFREGEYFAIQDNPSIAVTDISAPIQVPITDEVKHLSILVFNCYVSNTKVDVDLEVMDKQLLNPAVVEGEPGVIYNWSVPFENPPENVEYLWDFCSGAWTSQGGNCNGETPSGSAGLHRVLNDNKFSYLYTREGTFTITVKAFDYDVDRNNPIAEFTGKAVIQSKSQNVLPFQHSEARTWWRPDSGLDGPTVDSQLELSGTGTGPNFVEWDFEPSSTPRLNVYVKLSGHIHTVTGAIKAQSKIDGVHRLKWKWTYKSDSDHWFDYELSNCHWKITDSRIDPDNPSSTVAGAVWNFNISFDPQTDWGENWWKWVQAGHYCDVTITEKEKVEKDGYIITETKGTETRESQGTGQYFTISFGKDYYP
jgi:hypothetical protein